MAYIHFDSSYAPCGFLIVRTGGNPYRESDTVLVQTDWDYPGVARSMGWSACDCGSTDGTVDCEACERNVSDMLSEAIAFIRDHEGEEFSGLDDYFTGE